MIYNINKILPVLYENISMSINYNSNCRRYKNIYGHDVTLQVAVSKYL